MDSPTFKYTPEKSYTPKGLPKYLEMGESTTPKYTPNKSYTPKGLLGYFGARI